MVIPLCHKSPAFFQQPYLSHTIFMDEISQSFLGCILGLRASCRAFSFGLTFFLTSWAPPMIPLLNIHLHTAFSPRIPDQTLSSVANSYNIHLITRRSSYSLEFHTATILRRTQYPHKLGKYLYQFWSSFASEIQVLDKGCRVSVYQCCGQFVSKVRSITTGISKHGQEARLLCHWKAAGA